MIRISSQSFTRNDLEAETRDRGTPMKNMLAVALPVTAVIYGVTYWLTSSGLLAALPAILFAGFSGLSNLLYAARIHRLQTLVGREGSVEVIEVEAESAEALQRSGGKGPAYCFFSSDGQALLLVGEWLLETRQFPALRFRLLRMASTGEPIRLEALSEPISPQASSSALKSSHKPEPSTLLRATPGNLQAVIDRELIESKSKAKDKK